MIVVLLMCMMLVKCRSINNFIDLMVIYLKRINYMSDNFMHELLVYKDHKGGLIGYFGVKKTLDVLYKHFYWPRIKHDVQRVCYRCISCRQAKSKVLPHGLYTH